MKGERMTADAIREQLASMVFAPALSEPSQGIPDSARAPEGGAYVVAPLQAHQDAQDARIEALEASVSGFGL